MLSLTITDVSHNTTHDTVLETLYIDTIHDQPTTYICHHENGSFFIHGYAAEDGYLGLVQCAINQYLNGPTQRTQHEWFPAGVPPTHNTPVMLRLNTEEEIQGYFSMHKGPSYFVDGTGFNTKISDWFLYGTWVTEWRYCDTQ